MKEYIDHLGKKYKTFARMAAAYGMSSVTLRERLKHMTMKEALTTPKRRKGGGTKEIYVFGKSYKSISEAARAFGVSCATLRVRLSRGEDPETAIKKEKDLSRKRDNTVKDENGNEYKNLKEAATVKNIPYVTVRGRTNHGWTREEALLIPQDFKTIFGSGRALFNLGGVKYYSFKCPICNNEYVMNDKERRQHYVRHIKPYDIKKNEP